MKGIKTHIVATRVITNCVLIRGPLPSFGQLDFHDRFLSRVGGPVTTVGKQTEKTPPVGVVSALSRCED